VATDHLCGSMCRLFPLQTSQNRTRSTTQSAYGREISECKKGRISGFTADAIHRALQGQYNLEMADRIACSCVTCPKCGTWVVLTQPTALESSKEKFRAGCPVLECGKEFEFEAGETHVFELPLPLFERRHFYGSELR
jgi:hypothetical protein